MTRSELEHVIRAAGSIADDAEIVVIGSQSLLGQFPEAPAILLASMAADVFPRNHADRADLIDGAIGEGSLFHQSFGYYAQGVSERTVTLPEGWQERLVRVSNPNTHGVTGLCLEVHDLAISKHVAGREKDLEFTRELARNDLIDKGTLIRRLQKTPVDAPRRKLIAGRIDRDFDGR